MKKTYPRGAPDTLLRPTTKDLARAAGVSRATVDRVLNGREGVKPETVQKVMDAIETLGFVRNLSAANLAKGRSYRFLFVLPQTGDQFLDEIRRHIGEAEAVFAAERIWTGIHAVDGNDPYRIADYLATLGPAEVDGVAIMAPETPQVRDAIVRLRERGVRALPFISNQALSGTDLVGIDNRAAGRTAATLMGRFIHAGTGRILVVAESMQSRDSLERRLGFDEVMHAQFPHLATLPSLETYGAPGRAARVMAAAIAGNPDIAGVYVMSAEARIPVEILARSGLPGSVVAIAHERTPFTMQALRAGTLDAVITQDSGHLVRSAIRRLRALADRLSTLDSQEKIRIEILLPTNL
ncbi:LacI family DNA-binding transcriptional regulator [Poseidonocella sp. HB161398]|uniref:LacI family DNA-binding transcriptional regulator n=1 Tax=Poseidonocella sp. HB161398 TaxID=2320855 RepID=UPI001107DBD7|nr:LacI family DNA-binding transcriptional regulator [Poseidonocella sp. HB161398]